MQQKGNKMEAVVKFNKQKARFEGFVDGKMVARSKHESYVKNSISKMGFVIGTQSNDVSAKASEFGINERFTFVEQMVSMVAKKTIASAIITGQGGLGKTHTVLKALKSHGMQDTTDLSQFEVGARINTPKAFRLIKGFSTAKGLYRTLFEGNGQVLVFDDCDSVLKDPTSLNLLKGALDSYSRRIISWRADMRDDELPTSFEFKGRVVFISNLASTQIDQAIITRSMAVDLTMTNDQKIERMRHLLVSGEFMPEFDKVHKVDAMNLIDSLKDSVKELSLRTLIQVTKIRKSAGSNWRNLAEYTICG